MEGSDDDEYWECTVCLKPIVTNISQVMREYFLASSPSRVSFLTASQGACCCRLPFYSWLHPRPFRKCLPETTA